VPPGFVPTQDKEYLVAFAQLPDGSTLDRTDSVIRKMTDIALKNPGVLSSVAFPGPLDQRLRQRAEHGHRVRRAEAVAGAEGPRA
jgi:multidrug efflux pump subunit AcrB